MPQGCRTVVLRRRPEGTIAGDDFEIVETRLPEPGPGQLLVRTLWLSLDPYMASAVQQRHPSGAVAVGDVMPGETIGVVEQSNHERFAEGDLVLSRGGWATHSLAEGAPPLPGLAGILSRAAHPVAPLAGVPASAYLGVLGMPGLTAYAVTTTVLRPQPGETVAVLAAAGAVGAAAGQLARSMGARAVGIVGTQAKAEHVRTTLGFDAAAVRGAVDFEEQLAAATPRRIDAVLANVTGPTLEAVLRNLALHARVALIGDMAQYNSRELLPGPALTPLLGARASITGFVVYDHYGLLPRWQELAAGWLAEGRLTCHEDVSVGLAAAPEAFARLMRGQTTGKAVVDVAAAP